ncbi:unnamed protein product, partial [Larinioides sclopetarius]
WNKLHISKNLGFFRRSSANWKRCLGRDGLHLNFRGNHELVEDVAKQIENRISTKYLYHRKARSIVPSTANEWDEIRKGFLNSWNFSDCYGGRLMGNMFLFKRLLIVDPDSLIIK